MSRDSVCGADGVTVETWNKYDGDRYEFDLKHCRSADGWAQCDTAQDASYFGIWVNPKQRKLMTYCEGDCTMQTAATDADFTRMVRQAANYYTNSGYGFKIDAMCDRDMFNALVAAGLSDLLH